MELAKSLPTAAPPRLYSGKWLIPAPRACAVSPVPGTRGSSRGDPAQPTSPAPWERAAERHQLAAAPRPRPALSGAKGAVPRIGTAPPPEVAGGRRQLAAVAGEASEAPRLAGESRQGGVGAAINGSSWCESCKRSAFVRRRLVWNRSRGVASRRLRRHVPRVNQ